ncbi:unnamed protein product [Parnassius apollo]|uniref:(apollo) hypothetical protein n=1 Tax=Parnassius apollo TaxID=110799 RepID=A0A8S3XYW8_PARAO|nr:unnamed protein product [Parnassius apollo]
MYVHKIEALNEIPDIDIDNMPQHKIVTEWLLQDIRRGNHLLLVDNQGFESNKSTERLLQLLNRPTEYIQLHRDTTIQSLTVQPTFKNGTVTYEDSPLVKAVKYGYVLVVGEADKAPIKVTSRLNTLMEYKVMVLGDGRKIIPKEFMNSSGSKSSSFIPVHKNFRMIIMTRRTGLPFFDKDFSASLGNFYVV